MLEMIQHFGVVVCINMCRYLFLDHVKTVGSFVSKRGKTPLIWDDMLRNIPRTDIQVIVVIIEVVNSFNYYLQYSGIGGMIEVMVWSYTEDIDR